MENNVDALASDSLAHLQRLYRIAESDRRAYCQDTKVTLLRQRKIIHKLEAKREEILSKVRAGDGSGLVRGHEPQFGTLLDVYKRKKLEHQQGRQEVQSQKSEIQSLTTEIEKLLIKKAKLQSKRNHISCNTKTREILEDRLENASVHYNVIVYKNTTLRNTIEHLLKQRFAYRQILRNLTKTLSSHKNDIENFINKAILNYNLREDKYRKLQTMKSEHALDESACKSQVQEAHRMHLTQKQLVEFIGTKSHSRPNGFESANSHAAQSRSGAERDRVSRYGQHRTECPNAEFFTYTSSINNKIEELRNELTNLRHELDELESVKVQKDERNKVTVRELEVDLVFLNRDCSQSESQLDKLRKIFNKLKTGVEGMLQLVVGHVCRLNDDNDGDATTPSVMRAIKQIENEVNELLLTRQFVEDCQTKEMEKLSSPAISGRTRELRPFRKIHRSIDIPLTPPKLNLEQEVESFLPESSSGERIVSRTQIQEVFVVTSDVVAAAYDPLTTDTRHAPVTQK